MIRTNFPDSFYLEEEKKFVVSPDAKRIWAVLLDLLIEFDRVCKEHGIKYMIDGGTQLGAMRHGGFIPWDDDIDVIMLREEYEKLSQVAPTAFRTPYFWQTIETDPDHGRAFARLRNSSTTMIPKYEMRNGKGVFHHNQGALIDVFICDNVPDDENERRRFLKCVDKHHSRGWGARMSRVSGWSLGLVTRLPDFLRKLTDCLLRLVGIDLSVREVKIVSKLAQTYNNRQTEYVSHITFCPDPDARMCLMVPRRIFENLTEISFEGYKFPTTKFSDEYLTIVYHNWRKFVVGDGGGPMGAYVFSDEKPYTDYL